jgi:ABC transport system ATP-binding/permease protein
MALIGLRDVSLALGGPLLLDGVNLQIERGERIGLVGRNGAGKSTLLRLINDEISLDGGQVVKQPGVRTALLTQEVPANLTGAIADVVAGGAGPQGELLAEFHELSRRLAETRDSAIQDRLDAVQHELDVSEGWQVDQQVDQVISRMKLDPQAEFSVLSSGMKRRVLLARALVTDPDVLLLDEPTNHLDIDAIRWLEDFLPRYEATLIFVTHDRVFLQNLAKRIIEIDRARLFDWECDYATFLKRKQEALEAEAQQQALFDKKLAEEEVWIRQGIKARRTRNEGRVRALKKLREERQARRDRTGNVRLAVQEVERSGNLVLEAKHVDFSYGDHPVVRDFSTLILRGDRVGLIGPNGSGKTTLLRILLGELQPQAGTVRHGTRLQIAYFDQLRAQIVEDQTVQENVGEGADTVLINGQRRHVIGYLQDFLFSPDRARSPARYLSGGERNRLLLAKLFTKPSNVLVLDEPTNDLDAETLELLEEVLAEYPGTLLLVSHDRAFLNNVVTSTIAFEGDGRFKEYAGGYDDWVRQRSAENEQNGQSATAGKPAAKPEPPRRQASRTRKLSYREQQELETLPKRIEDLEAEQQQLHDEMADPKFYQQAGSEIAKSKDRLQALEAELSAAYERWEALEEVMSDE